MKVDWHTEPPTLHLPDLSSASRPDVPLYWEVKLVRHGGDITLTLVSGVHADRVHLAYVTRPTVEDIEHAAIRIWRNYQAVNQSRKDANP